MKVSTLKTEKRYDSYSNRWLKIQAFGEFNDTPQRLQEIVAASPTGKACVGLFADFLAGRGFASPALGALVLNSKGDTADSTLRKVADDYALFGGFALHVNYNALGEIVSVCHVPFEWLRFEELDDKFAFSRVALHPDWGRRFTRLRPFRPSDVQWLDLFNPDPSEIARQVERDGGWDKYRGQILYYSNAGDKVYPMPIYEAVVTDMSNEEGLSNITQRNVRHNFLPAGMVVDYDNTNNSGEQENETKKELAEFQGDTKAGQLLYVTLRNGDKAPEFVPFVAKNFDKDFEKAEAKTPQIIGRAFLQPPILRAEDVGGNFGQDTMKNAYNFYNSVTEGDRANISYAFSRVLALWRGMPSGLDYSIAPKVYQVSLSVAERLGDRTSDVAALIFDAAKPEKAKRAVLETVYGLDKKEIDELMEGLRNDN